MILDSVSSSWPQYLDNLEQHIVVAAYPAEVTWSHLKARVPACQGVALALRDSEDPMRSTFMLRLLHLSELQSAAAHLALRTGRCQV